MATDPPDAPASVRHTLPTGERVTMDPRAHGPRPYPSPIGMRVLFSGVSVARLDALHIREPEPEPIQGASEFDLDCYHQDPIEVTASLRLELESAMATPGWTEHLSNRMAADDAAQRLQIVEVDMRGEVRMIHLEPRHEEAVFAELLTRLREQLAHTFQIPATRFRSAEGQARRAAVRSDLATSRHATRALDYAWGVRESWEARRLRESTEPVDLGPGGLVAHLLAESMVARAFDYAVDHQGSVVWMVVGTWAEERYVETIASHHADHGRTGFGGWLVGRSWVRLIRWDVDALLDPLGAKVHRIHWWLQPRRDGRLTAEERTSENARLRAERSFSLVMIDRMERSRAPEAR